MEINRISRITGSLLAIFLFLGTAAITTAQTVPGVFASAITAAPTSTLTNGLVSYWKFDETSGTTANDDWGTTDLTNSGATVNQAGTSGTSYQFAPNDYVGNIEAFKYTTAFSLSLMIRTSNTTGNEAPIGNFHWTGDGYDLVRMATTGYLEWTLRNSTSGSALVEYTTNVADGNWHHVACIYDGSYARLYVDGVAATPVAFSYTISYNAANRFCIGTRENDDNFYTGYIDEICVYNRALTASEVSELDTNNGKPY